MCSAEGAVRPSSAGADLTPPLTARKAQGSRLKGLNEKVEKLLQVYCPTHPTMSHGARSTVHGAHKNCCWCTHLLPQRYCLFIKHCQHRLCFKEVCQAKWKKLLLHSTEHSNGG